MIRTLTICLALMMTPALAAAAPAKAQWMPPVTQRAGQTWQQAYKAQLESVLYRADLGQRALDVRAASFPREATKIHGQLDAAKSLAKIGNAFIPGLEMKVKAASKTIGRRLGRSQRQQRQLAKQRARVARHR